MKLISWNVHYDVNIRKYNHITAQKPDILILLECTKNAFDFIKDDWTYKNFYNDDLNYEYSNLGIAVFSNNFKIEFTSNYNRNYRYVIPYRISNDSEYFYVFAVWTKDNKVNNPTEKIIFSKDYCAYEENIIRAIEDPMYEKYISDNTIIIGDYNTGNVNDYKEMEKHFSAFENCAKIVGKEFRYTYCKDPILYYTNDFCYITKSIRDNYEVKFSIAEFDEKISSVNQYYGLSDHCPIVVEFIKR